VSIWTNTFFLATGFILLFASAELMYHKFKIKAELTRKYVHFLTGFLTLLFPFMLNNHWFVLLLCGLFAALLILSKRLKLLPSINNINRESTGSFLYPAAVYSCYFISDLLEAKIYFYVPILILAVADPFAALFGKKWPLGQYTILGHTKTLVGSTAFFVCSLITVTITFWLNGFVVYQIIPIVFFLAFSTTMVEAISHKGYDNLTIPAITLLILMFL
tara:strand:+ start:1556 stop:2209 length:654 start_codon:yes stop_codon:yes gene_type:complete